MNSNMIHNATGDSACMRKASVFLSLQYDCQWMVPGPEIRNSALDIVKVIQIVMSAVTLIGDTIALAVYANLIRHKMDISMHGYLLILSLTEMLHQVCCTTRTLETYLDDKLYDASLGIQFGNETDEMIYLLKKYATEIIKNLSFGLYASRNYWVMIIVCNRCLMLKCYESNQHHVYRTSRERVKWPFLMGFINVILWNALNFVWTVFSQRISVTICRKNEYLYAVFKHTVNETDYYNQSLINGTNDFIQAHSHIEDCIDSTQKSMLQLLYFSTVTYFPFIIIASGCLATWLQVRRHPFSGRYARVRNVLIVITTSYAVLELPTLVIQMATDVITLLNDERFPKPQTNTIDTLKEMAETFSGLNSTAILIFYLFSDPTFLSYTRGLFCKQQGLNRARTTSISYRETWQPNETSICCKSCPMDDEIYEMGSLLNTRKEEMQGGTKEDCRMRISNAT